MASCPNCGFDLDAQGRCAVCGYGSSAQYRRARTGSARGRRRTAESEGRDDRSPEAGGRDGSGRATGLLAALTPSRRAPLATGAVAFLLVVGAAALLFVHRSAPSAAALLAGSRAAAGGSLATLGAAEPSKVEATMAGKIAGSAGVVSRPRRASSPAGASGTRVKITRQGFAAPVGASPVSIRATHAVNLYAPPTQPVYPLSRRTALPPLTSENAYVRWMLAHTDQKAKLLRERWHRARLAVERHLVVHRSVVLAFLLTPREWFARPFNLAKVYDNTALPIGYGQTISGPDLVMHMTDALDPRPNQKVLEIGTGSGYQSAILSQLSNFVYTIEIVRPLAEQTNEIYLEHTKQIPEYANIHRRLADGYYGWPAYAPFDRIIVTTGIDHIPPDLLKELKPGGIMVIPIGPPTGQTILKITKTVDKQGRVHLTRTNLYPGVTDIFVPFTSSGGGTHDFGGNRR